MLDKQSDPARSKDRVAHGRDEASRPRQLNLRLSCEALEEALARYGKPVFNTDQGSQFTSADFTGVLIEADVRISTDGRGRWMDNVFIERVWRSLKYEDVYLKDYADGREAKAGISDWVIFYNEQRLHQALGYRAPMAVWRERAPPKAFGHVVNANPLTTFHRRIRNSSRHNPWRIDKGQPADALPT